MRSHGHSSYRIVPFPWARAPIVDSLRVARGKPLMHALIEVDVTAPREAIAAYERANGVAVSFTAFIVSCVARAVTDHQVAQAYRYGRKRLILFDDVDVCAPIERIAPEGKQATPYVIRAANRKSILAIHREIRAAQRAGLGGAWEARLRRLYPRLPRLLRWAFWQAFSRSPRLKRRIGGTVQVTAVGMFGAGAAWGISPVSDYSLMIVIGGIAEKPGVVDGRVAIRQHLCLTVSADHNVVDGAPLARFTQRLRELIESGAGLVESGIAATAEPAGPLSATATGG